MIAFEAAHPVDRTFDFALSSFAATASRSWVVSAVKLFDLAGLRIFDDFFALDDVAVTQPHFATWFQAEELLRCIFLKIILLDVEFARERNLSRAGRRVFGVVHGLHHLDLVFRVVGQYNLYWIENCHDARGDCVQVFANAVFQNRYVNRAVETGNSDSIAEQPQAFGCEATAPQAADGWHARIVPAFDMFFLHELQQLALTHHGVAQIESREFDLARVIDAERFAVPIVQRPMVLELKRTDRMSDLFE